MVSEKVLPTVSILMPAYNAANTITFALASLLAQTYEDWECVVVDDGSSDETVERVLAIDDPRIRLNSLGKNYGRGVARQRSLELASGKYITMLDADDWIYPDKLREQVDFLDANPDVSLHSMAMAIVEGANLISVRKSARFIDRRLDRLHRTFIPHAPSMLRRAAIADTRYDERFLLAQDQDFLRRVLIGKRYVVSTTVGYSYSEHQSVNIRKIIRGYLYNSLGYLKLVKFFGLRSVAYSIVEICKIPYMMLVFFVKGERGIIEGRSTPASLEEKAAFNHAFARVAEHAEYLGNTKMPGAK